jgi:prolyl-tRNA editing enzyme YbaK/EbsC (Cys-tRNA(Pro) deacylase)
MEIGGVTPFGLPHGVVVWIDAAVMERESLVLGGGSRAIKVLTTPRALAGVPGVLVIEGLANPMPSPS